MKSQSSLRRSLRALLAVGGLGALLSLGACSSSNGPTQPGQPTPPSAEGNWILEHGTLTTVPMLGLWASGPNDVWGVSASGFIAHFDGTGWNLEDPWDRDPSHLWDIWGASANAIWAVGESSALWHYDGERWGLAAGNIETSFYCVWGSSGSDVWAAGNGKVFHYDGSEWTLDVNLAGDTRAIVGTGPNDVFVGGSGGNVWRYDGSGWTLMSTPTTSNLFGACVDDQNRVYMVGDNGTVIRWNGASWSALPSGSTQSLYSVASVGDKVYAVGTNGTILLYDGSGWGVMTSGVGVALWSVEAVSNSFLVACGDEGVVLAGDGATWQQVFTTENFRMLTADLADDGSAWAGDGGARMWRRTNDGWELSDSFGTVVRGLWSAASDDVWAVGDNGHLWRWNGSAWSDVSSPTSQALYAIDGNAATGEAWAVGYNGTVLRYDPGGDSWSTVSSGTTYTLRTCVVQADGTVYVAGAAGTLLRWDPSEEAWQPEQLGWEYEIADMVGLASGSLVACDSAGHVFWRSAGGGWRTEWVGGDASLTGVWASSPNAVWILDESGRIKFYNGEEWSTVADLGYGSFYAVDGNADGEIIAAGEFGRILHYTP
ncbi:hypothetical protein KDL67_15360 [bacterium]|nr:hypothetical protein [bacterium]